MAEAAAAQAAAIAQAIKASGTLAFFAVSTEPLPLPGRAEIIDARRI